MHDIDVLVRQRAKMLLLAALAFALWQFGWIASDVLDGRGGLVEALATAAMLAGGIAWAAWSIAFYVLGRRIQSSPDAGAVDDEQARLHRLLAFRGGYFVLGGATLLLIPSVANLGVDATYGIRAVAILGLVTPMFLFGRLELMSDAGADE